MQVNDLRPPADWKNVTESTSGVEGDSNYLLEDMSTRKGKDRGRDLNGIRSLTQRPKISRKHFWVNEFDDDSSSDEALIPKRARTSKTIVDDGWLSLSSELPSATFDYESDSDAPIISKSRREVKRSTTGSSFNRDHRHKLSDNGMDKLKTKKFSKDDDDAGSKNDYSLYLLDSDSDVPLLQRLKIRPSSKNVDETKESSAKVKSSGSTAPKQATKKASRGKSHVQCVACTDDISRSDSTRGPCSRHYFCRDCLRHLIILSSTDEALFPPSCCSRAVGQKTLQRLLSKDELQLYRSAEKEYKATDRIYCPLKTCGIFIPIKKNEGVATGKIKCKKCKAEVCKHCKGSWHVDECKQDKQLQDILELAAKENWKRCPKCSAMIQRDEGCLHIECTCKCQFCYSCGVEYNQIGQCDCKDKMFGTSADGWALALAVVEEDILQGL